MADFKIQTVIEIGPEGTSRQAKGVAVFDSAKVLGWERHEDESLPDIKLIADDGGTGNGSVQCSLRPIYDLDRLTRVLERGKACKILADTMDSRAVAEEMLAPRPDCTEAETPYQRLPGYDRAEHDDLIGRSFNEVRLPLTYMRADDPAYIVERSYLANRVLVIGEAGESGMMRV